MTMPPGYPRIGVVVMSFNRPRMLRQALESVRGFDQVVIADDGSNFDPQEVADELGIEAICVRNEPMPGVLRVKTPRMGKLFNRALNAMQTHAVGYLCDDDVFSPQWYPAARRYLRIHPEVHILRGDWHVLGSASGRTALPPNLGWTVTTGNFIHRIECVRSEGVRWNEAALAVQDAHFLTAFLVIHHMLSGGFDIPHAGVLAGWRREHDRNLIHYTRGLHYAPGAEGVLDSGTMEGTPLVRDH